MSALLMQAIWRLTPLALEPWERDLMTPSQKGIYIGWLILNAYLEGYRGFQLKFCPRVVSRAVHLGKEPTWIHVLLALPFCMSLFHASRKQLRSSWLFLIALVLLITAVRALPQPYRGMVDGGVVIGLAWGLLVIWWLFAKFLAGLGAPAPTDLPAVRQPLAS